MARDASELSLEDAARMAGVESDVWSAWENDRSDPGNDHIETIATSLRVSGVWLLTGFGLGPRWPGDEALP